MGTGPTEGGTSMKSQTGEPKTTCLISSILVEHGSTVQSIDKEEDEPSVHGKEDRQGGVDCNPVHELHCVHSEISDTYPRKRHSQEHEDDMAAKSDAYRKHHRRNPANTNIVVPNEKNSAKPGLALHKANANTVILSPNPISPAHQLRVTNSIPQLMKALPPLPDEVYEDKSHYGPSSTEVEVSTRLLFASSPASTSAPVESDPSAGLLSSIPLSYSNNSENPSYHKMQPSPSRFKVRLRSSHATGLHSKWSFESSSVPPISSSNPIKPRLRLKVSRNRMNHKRLIQDGTVVRNGGLRQYNSLLELKDFPQRDVLTDRSSFGEALEKQLAQMSVDNRLSNIDEGPLRSPSRQLSDQFDIPYPPSTGGIVVASLVTQSKLKSELEVLNQQRDSDVTEGFNTLGKRASFLRPRGTLMGKGRKPKGLSTMCRKDPTLLRSNVARNSSLDDSIIAPSQVDSIRPRRSHNKTRRMRRWASEAKRAVRSYVKRTLNRSWSSDSQ
ncbi:hypothetical protein FSARC_13009 [Fusarium sarcochroum]|uniref:Uncharacterized protein n=1 Tax=Fusarium sarcochroum TaxID=1208366 RepID=A0A8H4WUA0_9HYPO|nr:hypothetical protein FSARC_13009 [Fusarium sarcochroum]